MTEVLLKELTNSDIDWLISTGRRREIAPGTVLIQAGQTIDSLHILLDGILTVTVSQADNNPLSRAFAAIEGNENTSREISRLYSGEVVGEIPFVSVRAIATTVRAVEKSLVMSISQQELATKLQQDVGFAARFTRAIAILLSDRLQNLIDRFGRSNLAQGQPLKDVLFILGELHDSDLDWMMACGTQKYIPANTVVIHEGRPIDALSIILSGTMSMSVSQTKSNPLTRAFAAIEGGEIPSREIARLFKGDFVGETHFIDGRLPAATFTTLEDSFVLSILRQQLAIKLQQDVGFASRFYRAIATSLSHRLQGTMGRLGYTRRFYSKGQPLDQNVEYEDELNANVLDRVALAGKRFNWILEQSKA